MMAEWPRVCVCLLREEMVKDKLEKVIIFWQVSLTLSSLTVRLFQFSVVVGLKEANRT